MSKRSRGMLLVLATSLFGAGLVMGGMCFPGAPGVTAQADAPTECVKNCETARAII